MGRSEAGQADPEAVALPQDATGAIATLPPLSDRPVDGARRSGRHLRFGGPDSVTRRLLAVADMVTVSLAMIVSGLALGDDRLALGTIAVLPLFVVVIKTIGLYDRDAHLLHKTTLDEIPSLFVVATLSAFLIWLSNGLLVDGELSRGQVLVLWASLFVGLVALRSAARFAARQLTPTERCLFVGRRANAEELRRKIMESQSVKAELIGWIPEVEIGGGVKSELKAQIETVVAEQEVGRIVLGPGHSEEMLDSVRRIAGERALKVSVMPDVARVVDSSVELDRLNGLTLLGLNRFEISLSSQVIKRSFDLVGSALALILLTPLLASIALAVKLDSRGPVLFRQRRAGRHGEPFGMLKFRSMVDGAEAQQDALLHLNEADGVFKIADDPRITRVGAVIRRYHLDELAQLINVLKGEMSLVGPRPLPLSEDGRIKAWHRRRLDLRPGITGVWQVLGSSRIPVHEMVRLDYQYVATWSLWNDLRILLLTVPHVLARRGL